MSSEFWIESIKDKVDEHMRRLQQIHSYLDIDANAKELTRLAGLSEQREFWSDVERAKEISKRIAELADIIDKFHALEKRLIALRDLIMDADTETLEELKQDILVEENTICTLIREKDLQHLLDGEYDRDNCFFSIQAGAGGTESCDWASMLYKMYNKWADIYNFSCKEIDILDGEIAGIKKVTFKISGEYAYGYCKNESGVHRLVRKSPFDANNKRHTSFASVYVLPELDDSHLEIDISDDDLEITTCRASGAGGQHVNKRDSAVRIKHIPSGIVVASQQERSQIQNRQIAMKLLKIKLINLQRLERENKIAEIGGEKTDIGWGHQVRSYVFEPYEMIKDMRSGFYITNVASMMSGETVMDFMDSVLRYNAEEGKCL